MFVSDVTEKKTIFAERNLMNQTPNAFRILFKECSNFHMAFVLFFLLLLLLFKWLFYQTRNPRLKRNIHMDICTNPVILFIFINLYDLSIHVESLFMQWNIFLFQYFNFVEILQREKRYICCEVYILEWLTYYRSRLCYLKCLYMRSEYQY